MSFEQVVSFDGHDLSPWLLVTDVARKVAPSRTLNQVVVPGMDGCLLSSVSLDPLEITVRACVTRKAMADVSEARRALAAALSSRAPAPLYLPDEPLTYLMAVYKGGAQPDRLMQCPDVELAFLCPDPVAYGERRTEQVSGTKTIWVGGTYGARPVVTSTPPAGDYWQITNVGTGQFVRVEAAFTGRQTVVLDMGKERCTVNGSDRAVSISSDFFSIEGEAVLSVSGGSARVEWDERWL